MCDVCVCCVCACACCTLITRKVQRWGDEGTCIRDCFNVRARIFLLQRVYRI